MDWKNRLNHILIAGYAQQNVVFRLPMMLLADWRNYPSITLIRFLVTGEIGRIIHFQLFQSLSKKSLTEKGFLKLLGCGDSIPTKSFLSAHLWLNSWLKSVTLIWVDFMRSPTAPKG
jgi:hypothetical protein